MLRASVSLQSCVRECVRARVCVCVGGCPVSEETSPEFEEFLDFIADKVQLNKWTKFRAGLDVRSTPRTHARTHAQSLSLHSALTD
jgi:hypothetical protein